MSSAATTPPSVSAALRNFVRWLDGFGETSLDHQTFFAGPWGSATKRLYYERPRLGTLAVAPLILCEAFLPSARRFFHRQDRFPIADAHFAMGFAMLYEGSGDATHLDRASHYLDALAASRCPGYVEHCWGYPFDWVTRNGTIVCWHAAHHDDALRLRGVRSGERARAARQVCADPRVDRAARLHRHQGFRGLADRLHVLLHAIRPGRRHQRGRVPGVHAHERVSAPGATGLLVDCGAEPRVRAGKPESGRLVVLRGGRCPGLRRPLPHLFRDEGPGEDSHPHRA